jgi:hypothetical protein
VNTNGIELHVQRMPTCSIGLIRSESAMFSKIVHANIERERNGKASKRERKSTHVNPYEKESRRSK